MPQPPVSDAAAREAAEAAEFGRSVESQEAAEAAEFGGTVGTRITHPTTGVVYDVPAGMTPEAYLATITGAPPAEEFVDSWGAWLKSGVDKAVTPTRTAIDATIGAAQGAANTFLSSSKHAVNMPGYAAVSKYIPGDPVAAATRKIEELQASPALQPEGVVQKGGYIAEQAAELFAPGSKVSKIGQAMDAATRVALGGQRAAKVAGTLVRAGVEGLGNAAMALPQGSDPTVAGTIGGAIPVLGAAGRVAGRRIFPTNTPAMQSAIAGAEQLGFPADLPTRTGSRWLRSLQNLSGKATIGGGIVATTQDRLRQNAARKVAGELAERSMPNADVAAQGMALEPGGNLAKATVGQRLQATAETVRQFGRDVFGGRLSPIPLTKNEAGLGAGQGVLDTAAAHGTVSKGQYKIWDAAGEADAAARAAAGEAATRAQQYFKHITKFGQSTGFKEVYDQARKDGYTGTREELQWLFNAKQGEAVARAEQEIEGNLGKKILSFVSKAGGIGRYEPPSQGGAGVLQGEVDRFWEMTTAARKTGRRKSGRGFLKQQFRTEGALGGVGGVVRNDGLSVGEMAEALRNDSELAFHFDGMSDSDLLKELEQFALEADRVPVRNAGQRLAELGVQPGMPWWDDAAMGARSELRDRAAAAGVGGDAAKITPIGMPVDMSSLQRTATELKERIALLNQQDPEVAEGMSLLNQIIASDRMISAQDLEGFISQLKSVERATTRLGGGKNRAGGLATALHREAERILKQATDEVPGSYEALQKARAAHKTMRETEDYAGALGFKHGQPVKPSGEDVFAKFIAESGGDRQLPELQRLAQTSPDSVPELARAWLDDVVDKQAYDKWDRLGKETKEILFGSPQQIQKYDYYFRRVKELTRIVGGETGSKIAKNPTQMLDALTRHPDDLKKVAQQMPELGRAWLDDLFMQAGREEGYRGEQAILRKWNALDDEAKKIMFPNPQLRKDIGDFFTVAEKSIEDMNRSGSGYMAAHALNANRIMQGLKDTGKQFGAAGPVSGAVYFLGGLGWTGGVESLNASLSYMLHSPRMARALTKAVSLRSTNPKMAGAIIANLLKEQGGGETPATQPEARTAPNGIPAGLRGFIKDEAALRRWKTDVQSRGTTLDELTRAGLDEESARYLLK